MSELDDYEQPPGCRIDRCGSRRGRPAVAVIMVVVRPKTREKCSVAATPPSQAPDAGFFVSPARCSIKFNPTDVRNGLASLTKNT